MLLAWFAKTQQGARGEGAVGTKIRFHHRGHRVRGAEKSLDARARLLERIWMLPPTRVFSEKRL
jgi:hypothetical protein